MSHRPASFASEYSYSVSTVWKKSVVAIEKESKLAINMLKSCSFYSNVEIPRGLLDQGFGTEGWISWQFMLETVLTFIAVDRVDDQVATLRSYSMIRRDRSDSISLHPLLHTWIRDHMDLESQKCQALEALRILTAAIHQDDDLSRTKYDCQFERRVMIHAESLWFHSQRLWPMEIVSQVPAKYWNTFACLFQAQGIYTTAELLYDRALRSAEAKTPIDDQEMFLVCQQFGKLRRLQGRTEEGRLLFQRILDAHKAGVKVSSSVLARAEMGMGVIAHNTRDYGTAEKLFLQALQTAMTFASSGDAEIDIIKSNLCTTYNRQKKFENAEAMYEQVLEGQKRKGLEHPNTLRTLQNLGVCLGHQAKYGEAQEIFQTVYQQRRRILGVDHPATLRTLHNLGWVHECQRLFDQAEKYYREAIEGRERALGENHLDTCRSIRCLAEVYLSNSQKLQAKVLFTKALRRLEEQEDATRDADIREIRKALEELDLEEDKSPLQGPKEELVDTEVSTIAEKDKGMVQAVKKEIEEKVRIIDSEETVTSESTGRPSRDEPMSHSKRPAPT